MKRINIEPRKDYVKKIEELGFNFHTDPDGHKYWKENACYEFTEKEVELIEKAGNEGYKMFCDAFQYVYDMDLWGLFGIPEKLIPYIKKSWDEDQLSIYGRFDMVFSPKDNMPKILEFNSDTPSLLLESSILQWNLKEEVFPDADQFNLIHESLVNSWIDIHQRYNSSRYYFACSRESVEDQETTQYLLSTAMEAGLNTAEIEMEQLLWEENDNCFYSPGGERIETCFKMYPWEFLYTECLDACLADCNWIEPMWKMIMCNKNILPIVHRLFPDSPFILKASTSPVGMSSYAKKATLGREGENITLVKDGKILEKCEGDYDESGYIYQELIDAPTFDGKTPVLGVWIIGGSCVGMGIRECDTKITNNTSEFIPHIIV